MSIITNTTIASSVGRGGVNRYADVLTVQQLINHNILSLIPLDALVEDGKIGSKTINAIIQFQQRVVQLAWPDGRVDPGGATMRSLKECLANSEAGLPAPTTPSPPPPVANVFLIFKHGNKTPGTANTNDRYESRVELTIQTGGSEDYLTPIRTETRVFRGSIYPDDMNAKGRVRDGVYDLSLGFHRRKVKTTDADGNEISYIKSPTNADLEARDQGFRAALIVQNDGYVSVQSDNASKTMSHLIHVHNGFRNARYSDGCQTIHPDDWSAFIQVFLDAYRNLSDWSSPTNEHIGRQVGSLYISA